MKLLFFFYYEYTVALSFTCHDFCTISANANAVKKKKTKKSQNSQENNFGSTPPPPPAPQRVLGKLRDLQTTL